MEGIVVSSPSICICENRRFPFREMPTASSRELAVPGSTNSRRAVRRVAAHDALYTLALHVRHTTTVPPP